jgi:hypothetical protein
LSLVISIVLGTLHKAYKPNNRQTNILEQVFDCIRHVKLPIAVTLTVYVYVCVHDHTQLTPFLMVISWRLRDKWVPVTTAWRVLRLRMEELPPIWRVTAKISE